MRGQIILLNGVSSSGKTKIAKNLQKKLPEPFFLLGNDIFTDEMAPEKFKETDWQELEYQSLAMMIKTIRLFSDEGKNVIADCVFLTVQKNDLLRECVDLLHEYPLLFVHVECRSAEDLSAREKKRGDRDIGQGASQLALLNPQDTYDLTVDTVKKTADECADRIIQMIERKNKSEAFHELFGNYVNER
jgi:chloramphenicol 3-O phosphotransferase